MFSYLCPKCGSEVPPSYSECPNCAGAAAAAPRPPAVQAAPPPPPPPPPPTPRQPTAWNRDEGQQTASYEAPYSSGRPPKPAGVLFGGLEEPVAPMAPQASYETPYSSGRPPKPAGVLFGGLEEPVGPMAPQASYRPPPPPPQRTSLPPWLVMLLVAGVVAGIVAAAVYFKRRSSGDEAPLAATESVAASAARGGHRFSKHIELTGFRLAEDARQRAQVKMLVINHSSVEIDGVEMTVNLRTANSKASDDPLATFNVKVPIIEPGESKEVTAPIKTKLRAYELPDWQFIRADFEITSP